MVESHNAFVLIVLHPSLSPKKCAKFVSIGLKERPIPAKVCHNNACGESQSMEMKGDDDDDL